MERLHQILVANRARLNTQRAVEDQGRKEGGGGTGDSEDVGQVLSRGIGEAFGHGEVLEANAGIVEQGAREVMRFVHYQTL